MAISSAAASPCSVLSTLLTEVDGAGGGRSFFGVVKKEKGAAEPASCTPAGSWQALCSVT